MSREHPSERSGYPERLDCAETASSAELKPDSLSNALPPTPDQEQGLPSVPVDDQAAHERAVAYNQTIWDRMALAGDRFYRAVTAEEIALARQGELKIRLTPTRPVPTQWLGAVIDRDVLCLAGGGARQAPLLAAAGARVTVFDLSEQQLQRDRDIANQESLDLTTVVGDMRDLRCFGDESFDLIVSPCATCFCPSVAEIWRESFRVLRPGGRLMTGFINPVHFLFDARALDRGKFVVRHRIPYSDYDLGEEEREALIGSERPIEFGHSLEALVGDQLAAGFTLLQFFEDVWGGSDPLSKRIPTFFATLVCK